MFAEADIRPVLAPGPEGEEQLQRWLHLMAEPNAGRIDLATGRIRAVLDEPIAAWQDVIAMLPDWGLYRSHRGPVSLMRRVDGEEGASK